MNQPPASDIVILISSNIEWKSVCKLFEDEKVVESPMGHWFTTELTMDSVRERIVFFHGGWGKISSSASTQYVIDKSTPSLIINIGTCGGFKGEIDLESIIIADKTIVYDIIELMYEPDEQVDYYTTNLDLSWLRNKFPHNVLQALIVSGDRDVIPGDIPRLKGQYGAIVGDWESGSIAWVAKKNKIACLILKGVSDIVGIDGGDAYNGNFYVFEDNTANIMKTLVKQLPGWVKAWKEHYPK